VIFHTGLFDHVVGARAQKLHFAGRGFEIRFRNTSTKDRTNRGVAPAGGSAVMVGRRMSVRSAHEALISSPPARAQEIANLLQAAWAVIDGGFMFIPEWIEPYRDSPDVRDRDHCTTGSIGHAAALAAAASHRKDIAVAVCRLAASYRAMSIHHMDMEPGEDRAFKMERDPAWWVTLAQAATTAFTAIEDINLKVLSFNDVPAKTAGGWDPTARQSLEQRLRKRGIDPATEVMWLARGTPTRLERKDRAPSGRRAEWAGGRNRDRSVNVMDALNYAQFIRNRAAAHAYSKFTTSLTRPEVANVQRLARALILRSSGLWGVIMGVTPVRGTRRAAPLDLHTSARPAGDPLR
jgi:hypothetical protein